MGTFRGFLGSNKLEAHVNCMYLSGAGDSCRVGDWEGAGSCRLL